MKTPQITYSVYFSAANEDIWNAVLMILYAKSQNSSPFGTPLLN